MKRKIIATVCTALLGIILLALPGAVLNAVPAVTIYLPQYETLQDSLKFRGCVTDSVTAEITSPIPLVAEKIFVQEGGRVQAGDPLFSVDRASTLSAYSLFFSELGIDQTASIGETIASLQNMLSSLPEEVRLLLTKQIPLSLDQIQNLPQNITLEMLLKEAVDALPDFYSAPCDGVVSGINISLSALSSPGRPLLSLGNQDEKFVTLQVPETEIKRIFVGQTVSLSGDTMKKTLHGRVKQIGEKAVTPLSLTETTPCFSVLVEVIKEDLPAVGCSVTGKILLGEKRESLILPYEAILQKGETEYIRILQDGKILDQEIKTGQELAKGVELLSGVSADAVVVITQTEEIPTYYRIREATS